MTSKTKAKTVRDPEIIRAEVELLRGEWRALQRTADVSSSWLSKFVARKFANPGWYTLELIDAYLLKPEVRQALATAKENASAL